MTQAVCNIIPHSKQTLTRRAALTGAAAVAVAMPVTANAAADVELIALGNELDRALERREAAHRQSVEASKRYRRPNEPALPQPPQEWAGLYKKITVGQMEMLSPDHPLVVWDNETREEHSRIFGGYLRRCQELQDECGATAAEENFSDRCQDLWDIGLQILALRARTFAGMSIKLRAVDLMSIDFEDRAQDAWDSIAADIQALAAVQS